MPSCKLSIRDINEKRAAIIIPGTCPQMAYNLAKVIDHCDAAEECSAGCSRQAL